MYYKYVRMYSNNKFPYFTTLLLASLSGLYAQGGGGGGGGGGSGGNCKYINPTNPDYHLFYSYIECSKVIQGVTQKNIYIHHFGL